MPKGKKVVIVLDNAKYNSRYVEKTPTMNMKKNDMIAFMINHGIEIPDPLPTKPVLLQKIRQANIFKKFVIDIMAKEAGFSVLRLPPCHCVLNLIEMVWNQLKHHTRHLNVYTSQPTKVLNLIREVCHSEITSEHWSNYVKHVINEENKFKVMDHILDNDTEPLIVHVTAESDDDSSYEFDDEDQLYG